jgi:mannose-6-phosphate isomerase-like protein (cupin superfamily)
MTGATTGRLQPKGCLLVKADEGRSPLNSPHVFKATASDTAGRFDFITGWFAPMTGPPLHFHVAQDDTFYVLEGILTVQVGEEIFDIGPGDFVSIPPRVPHTFDNLRNGDKPVRAINLMTPGGHFDLFNDMAAAEADAELGSVNDVAASYGTIITGPPLRIALELRGDGPTRDSVGPVGIEPTTKGL